MNEQVDRAYSLAVGAVQIGSDRLEQDHRGIKQRYYPMCGFGNFESAARFCCAFDELRNYFRSRHSMNEPISLPEQRQAFLRRLSALKALIQAAS